MTTAKIWQFAVTHSERLKTCSILGLLGFLPVAYFLMHRWMTDLRPESVIGISNLTVNYVAAFAIWGYLGIKLGEKWFPSRKALQWATFVAMFFILVFWLKLWGWEFRI